MSPNGVIRAVESRSIGSGFENVPPTKLATRLRNLRVYSAMTQAELAQFVGSPSRISDWETGVHIPSLATLQRYAEAFDTTVAKLLDGVM